ncbi:MAG TPA: EamA family transporter [Gaiellaceae bacterium]|nr:EamA family transporter [Gaiellaceae bacterium]
MAGWIVPTLGYIVVLGAGGVTAKLALRTITWEQLVLWVPIAYIVFSAILVIFNGTRFPSGVGSAWGAVTAFAMSSALILLFNALSKGAANQVLPASSAYPVITLIGAALFLAEKITVVRGIGTALVVGGVVLLSR